MQIPLNTTLKGHGDMFKRLLCLSVLAGGVVAMGMDTQMMKGPVETKQEIQVSKNGQVVATIRMLNKSSKSVLIEKIEGRLAPMRQEFEITCDGAPVDYIGPMAKRRPFTKGDFFLLAPGSEHKRTVRIDELYQFEPGNKKYEIKFYFLCFNELKGDVDTYSSDTVQFELKKE